MTSTGSIIIPKKITLAQCIEAAPMSAKRNKKLILETKHCIRAIENEIERFAAYFDINITPARKYLLASEAYDTWYQDSILDICTAIRNGTRGQHGTTYKTLTPANINEWMADHIDIKYQQREAIMKSGKKSQDPEKPLEWKSKEEYKAASKIGTRKTLPDKDDEFRKIHQAHVLNKDSKKYVKRWCKECHTETLQSAEWDANKEREIIWVCSDCESKKKSHGS